MIRTVTAFSAIAFASLTMFGGEAVAEPVDTFITEAILEDLADVDSAEEFEKRLRREAKGYCRKEAPYASRRELRTCEDEIVIAVAEALEEQNVAVAWNY
jgi:UrcA family protein